MGDSNHDTYLHQTADGVADLVPGHQRQHSFLHSRCDVNQQLLLELCLLGIGTPLLGLLQTLFLEVLVQDPISDIDLGCQPE
jgi:hypothetical protein